MACCGKPKSDDGPKKPAIGRQTEFMLEEHGWAFTRIAQLCVPKIARATEPRMLDGVSTKKEKEYVLEEYVSGLEAQGWFLKGPVEAIWAGERDLEKIKAAATVCTPGVVTVIETILSQAPSKPIKSYSRSKGTQRQQQREILGTGVSAETTAELAAFDSSEVHARSALELKQMERSTAKNPFFKDLDHDAKERLFNGCVHTHLRFVSRF